MRDIGKLILEGRFFVLRTLPLVKLVVYITTIHFIDYVPRIGIFAPLSVTQPQSYTNYAMYTWLFELSMKYCELADGFQANITHLKYIHSLL